MPKTLHKVKTRLVLIK